MAFLINSHVVEPKSANRIDGRGVRENGFLCVAFPLNMQDGGWAGGVVHPLVGCLGLQGDAL